LGLRGERGFQFISGVSFHPGKKIVLVIATLGAGGAERVMTMLAGEWVRRGNEVTLITLGDTEHDHYTVAPRVKRVGLDVLGASTGKLDAVRRNFARMARLRKAIAAEQPNAVISFMDATNVMTLLATRGMQVPVVVSERIDPRHYPIARGWQLMRRRLYPRADAVVVQTSSVAEWAQEFLPGERIKVIPNPVEFPDGAWQQDNTDWIFDETCILAMGRLDRQKGFDLLLRAFAMVVSSGTNRNTHASLVIVGEGPERQELQQQADELGLCDRVQFPGRIADPWPVLSRAKMFVLSSRFEGFPNALLEAMAAGCAVVSFNCPSGPADIISHEENGLLVPMANSGNSAADDEENCRRLSAAMGRLLRDEALGNKLGHTAKGVAESFSLGRIADEWERALAASPGLKAR